MNKVICTNFLLFLALSIPASAGARDWGETKASEAARKVAMKQPAILDLDIDIVSDARKALLKAPALKSQVPGIAIVSNDGKVTLSGVVATQLDRDLADSIVSQCHGVNQVVDNMKVAPLP